MEKTRGAQSRPNAEQKPASATKSSTSSTRISPSTARATSTPTSGAKSPSSATKSSGGFFSNLLASLFGGSDPEAVKRRQLNTISKTFSHTKFKQLYHYSSNEALPAMAKMFYDIYRATFPVRVMFQNIQNPNALKRMTISFLLPPAIKELEDALDEQKLMELSSKVPAEKLKQEALVRVGQYSDFFTLDHINQIDGLYNQLMAFKDFCMFDYFVLIRKFNKQLKEGDFTSQALFTKVNADNILNDLKDFMSTAWALPLDKEYDTMIKMLRTLKGVEPITSANWQKIIKRIVAFRTSGVFEMLIKLISADPNAVVNTTVKSHPIAEAHLSEFRQSVEGVISRLVNKERNVKSAGIAGQLFVGIETEPLHNFNDEMNETFEHKELDTFKNTQTLAYTKTFLIEVFKRDIREYYELVIVRGKWDSTAVSASFSEAYNNLMTISDKIIELDNSLEESAPVGMKIKTYLPKTDRDSGARNIINRLIRTANTSAYEYIDTTFNNILTIGRIVKDLIEDIDKKKPTLINNWKELSHFSQGSPKEVSVAIYKKIYLLTSLIKTSLVPVD